MLLVLGAIDEGYSTLVRIAARTALDKKTVTALLGQAQAQAGVDVAKIGAVYAIEDWGPVLKRSGAKKALHGVLTAPRL